MVSTVYKLAARQIAESNSYENGLGEKFRNLERGLAVCEQLADDIVDSLVAEDARGDECDDGLRGPLLQDVAREDTLVHEEETTTDEEGEEGMVGEYEEEEGSTDEFEDIYRSMSLRSKEFAAAHIENCSAVPTVVETDTPSDQNKQSDDKVHKEGAVASAAAASAGASVWAIALQSSLPPPSQQSRPDVEEISLENISQTSVEVESKTAATKEAPPPSSVSIANDNRVTDISVGVDDASDISSAASSISSGVLDELRNELIRRGSDSMSMSSGGSNEKEVPASTKDIKCMVAKTDTEEEMVALTALVDEITDAPQRQSNDEEEVQEAEPSTNVVQDAPRRKARRAISLFGKKKRKEKELNNTKKAKKEYAAVASSGASASSGDSVASARSVASATSYASAVSFRGFATHDLEEDAMKNLEPSIETIQDEEGVVRMGYFQPSKRMNGDGEEEEFVILGGFPACMNGSELIDTAQNVSLMFENAVVNVSDCT